MKKISAFILAVTMLLFTSCGKSDGAAGGEIGAPEAAETTTTTTTAAEVTTTTTAKVENTAKTGKLTIDDKIALKSANVNAKTAYNATAMYLSEQETNGFTFEESLSDKFFADGTTEGIDLEAERPAAEGDSIVYDAMKKADVESGLICVKKCKIDDFDSFMVQFKTKEGWIGQYPDGISVDNAAKVKWGEYLPSAEKKESAETTTQATTAAPEESATEKKQSKDRNGFDAKSNISYKSGGLVYSIPNYYNQQDEITFYSKEFNSDVLLILPYSVNNTSVTVNKSILENYVNNSLKNFELIGSINNMTFSGFNSYVASIKNFDGSVVGLIVMIDNTEYNYVNFLMIAQKTEVEFEYISDFERILNSIQIDKSFKPETSNSSKEEKKNTSPITITNTYLSKDYSGNSVLVVEYKWTNFSDTEAYFGLLFNDKVYQNGVECKTAYFCDDIDSQALLTTVQPGATFTVKEAYTLRDSSQVQIIVKPLLSFSNEKYIDVKIDLK